jgi:hypothetical protein
MGWLIGLVYMHIEQSDQQLGAVCVEGTANVCPG